MWVVRGNVWKSLSMHQVEKVWYGENKKLLGTAWKKMSKSGVRKK